ncbi:MAG: hypothetical protein NC082_08275 [Clostridiales bacterium]|nr:hypothetical protein [Clostridiales bacterium]
MIIVPASRGQVNVDDDNRVAPVIPGENRYNTGRVFLERADKLLKPSADVSYQVLIGNILFRRGDMYMYCDSAHFDDTNSSLEAFGNVRMEQGDTLFVFADMLEYSDSTELAVLYADPGKKVRLINRDVELRTDIFNYDLGIELGYYEVGGELEDQQNKLTSIYGEYAPNTKDAIFRNRVHLTSLGKNDTLNIFTEALHYNTDTHIADLTDESTIISKDGTIYTYNGVYNTETSVADLYDRSMVVTTTGKTLTGDTLFYDRKAGYGEAWGNMILNDTVNKSKLTGDYGFYNELTDSAFVTGHALAVDYSSADSLSLHGDTIQAFRVINITRVPRAEEEKALLRSDLQSHQDVTVIADTSEVVVDSDVPRGGIVQPGDSTIMVVEEAVTEIVPPISQNETMGDTIASERDLPKDSLLEIIAIEPPELVDTLSVTGAIHDGQVHASDNAVLNEKQPVVPVDDGMIDVADTTHHIVAFPNVRFYRSDLQGVCDSMTFVQKDSLLYMNIDPVVWSGERQIFGEEIIVHMNDSTADRINLPKNAFMAEKLEDGYFNQMSGRSMVAHLAENTLRHLDMNGNVMIIFFPMEEDSTFNKVASAESSFLAADFAKGDIERLMMWPESTEVITPLYLAKRSIFFLKDFKWIPERRPLGHHDLFPKAPKDGSGNGPENDPESAPAINQALLPARSPEAFTEEAPENAAEVEETVTEEPAEVTENPDSDPARPEPIYPSDSE